MSDRVSVGKKTLCFDDFQCCPITVINFDDIEEVDIIYLFTTLWRQIQEILKVYGVQTP